MVSRKTIKDYGFKSLNDYYDYIVDSEINGQRSQVIELIDTLSKIQAVEFIQWMKREGVQDPSIRQELELLTLKSLKK
jgi:hypothetical protein